MIKWMILFIFVVPFAITKRKLPKEFCDCHKYEPSRRAKARVVNGSVVDRDQFKFVAAILIHRMRLKKKEE